MVPETSEPSKELTLPARLCGDYWLDARYDPFVLMEAAVAEQKQRAA
jgi:hypothetical protein